MPVRTLVVGPLMANCHLLIEGDGIAVIDPGGNPEQIVAAIEEIGLPAKVIIDTHGHADHIAANDVLRDRFEAPVLIHEADARMLIDPAANFSAMFGIALRLRAADRLLGDGDVIDVGARDGVYVRKGAHPGTGAEEGGANSVPTIGLLRVIHTPGHSPGGICLLCSEGLFTGDTLFAGSVGRTDFSRRGLGSATAVNQGAVASAGGQDYHLPRSWTCLDFGPGTRSEPLPAGPIGDGRRLCRIAY